MDSVRSPRLPDGFRWWLWLQNDRLWTKECHYRCVNMTGSYFYLFTHILKAKVLSTLLFVTGWTKKSSTSTVLMRDHEVSKSTCHLLTSFECLLLLNSDT